MLEPHKEKISARWFVDLIAKFIPDDADIEGKTPEDLIRSASGKAFWVSCLAALPPGPFGLATIVPDFMAVTKIQINLVYAVAKYYGRQGRLNGTILLLVFANEAGLLLGKEAVKRVGSRVVIRALGAKALAALARAVGAKIGRRLARRLGGRAVPFLLAPAFGYFSKRMTEGIGREAVKLFSDTMATEDPREMNG